MATWSVTPSVPHTGNTFNFPENTGTTSKNYTITYVDDNNCSVSTTYTVPANAACQSTCEIVLTSKDGDFPCDEGEYSGWWFGYEIYTTVGGVRTKTDEGDDYGDVILEDNCDGSDRTIYYGSAEITIDLSIIDDNPNCTVSGTFTQEGGSPSQKIITGCSQITFSDSNNFNNKVESYRYNGHNGSIIFDSIHPVFEGTWAAVKSSEVIPFANFIKPYHGGGYTHDYSNYYADCLCCQNPQPSVTGGTSGGSDSNSSWIQMYALEKLNWGLELVEGTKSTFRRTDSQISSVTLEFDAENTQALLYLDDACNANQSVQTPVGIGMTVSFEIYKNQTTQTGETIRCDFEVYIDLRTRQ